MRIEPHFQKFPEFIVAEVKHAHYVVFGAYLAIVGSSFVTLYF